MWMFLLLTFVQEDCCTTNQFIHSYWKEEYSAYKKYSILPLFFQVYCFTTLNHNWLIKSPKV